MQQYENLMQACEILKLARADGASSATPAWTMLYHAGQYLANQADAVMRGE